MEIKNLIFDLGGVIIDLAPSRTVDAFSVLSGIAPDRIYRAYGTEPEFFAYERGEISDTDFRTAVKRILKFDAPDEVFDGAWNAMLIDLPQPKLDMLSRLRGRFRLTFLSNTNGIHLTHVNTNMLPKVSTAKRLDDFVHAPYYSHKMGKRKPDPAAFMQVLEENDFQPHETLFIDDNSENIQAASGLGMQTFLVKHPDEVFQYFIGYE